MNKFINKITIISGMVLFLSACSGGNGRDDSPKKGEEQQPTSVYSPSDREKDVARLLLKDDIEAYLNGDESAFEYPSYNLLTASDLRKAYSENEARADSNYKGKKIIISGVVGSIGSGVGDVPYVTLKSGDMFNDPQLIFSRKHRDIPVDLNKNEKVRFSCAGGGSIIGTPILKNCSPVTEAVDDLFNDRMKELDKLYKNKTDVSDDAKSFAYLMSAWSLATKEFSACSEVTVDCIKNMPKPNEPKLSPEERAKLDAIEAHLKGEQNH